jgi:HlyD family secretion protein
MGTSSAPMSTGIRLESYEDMIVSVTVGKSDLLKIKVGMEAVITSLSSEYKGEVVYVSATASESSGGIDIGSIAGSLMGSGAGASGAEVKIKIHNPDEKIVIGFDVDIKIILDTIEDVLKVPVESVIYNSGIYSVFVYDEEEETVSKRTITKGSLDDTSYEIVDGLVEGEKVVKSPDPNMEDGTKIAKKNA